MNSRRSDAWSLHGVGGLLGIARLGKMLSIYINRNGRTQYSTCSDNDSPRICTNLNLWTAYCYIITMYFPQTCANYERPFARTICAHLRTTLLLARDHTSTCRRISGGFMENKVSPTKRSTFLNRRKYIER